MFRVLRPIYLFLIVSLPLVIAALPLCLVWGNVAMTIPAMAAAPWLYAWSYLLVCGALSLPFQKYIVAGIFPRDLDDPLYRGRRLYGLCWTFIYYNKPLYHLYLSSPLMKRALFRIFGYTGPMDFVIYPDSWIRDLPLLSIGKGSYIANRSGLGTNVVLRNGSILVGPITIGENCVVGHHSAVGLGTIMGNNCELGMFAITGLNPRYADNAVVSAVAIVGHNARLGNGTKVGVAVYVGNNCVVEDGIAIPAGARIRANSVLQDHADIEASRI